MSGGRNMDNADHGFSYDLFVVHSAGDRPWVDGYLKPALGMSPRRVVTPSDFEPTGTVPAEIERLVVSSRYTLLVLTPAFLADDWTSFGEQLVSFQSVDQRQSRLLCLVLKTCTLPLRIDFRVRLDCSDPGLWDEAADRLRDLLGRPEPVAEEIACPYPGMVPFRRDDSRMFFGREREIDDLLRNIRAHHFQLVVGTSGSGKSSLIAAGLLPRLDDARSFGRGFWKVRTLRPGSKPLERLSEQLGGELAHASETVSALLAVEPPARKLLLVVDQLEELFTQVPDRADQTAFLEAFKQLVSTPECAVIACMRADFYPDLMTSALWPVDRSQILDVVPLRGDALRQAITRPAEVVGVYLEDSLVERLIADAASEPGALPMLQETLLQLWSNRERRFLARAAYDAMGRDGQSGLAVAMATRADATLAALPPEEQRLARRVFLRLIQFGEGRPDTRRQVAVDDLRAASDPPGTFERVLTQLIENRLLTPSSEERRGRRVDIAHEMLIVGWPASREWVLARREAEVTRRRLESKAVEWNRLGRASGGLLDADELPEGERWLASSDAIELGIDCNVQDLVAASRAALTVVERRSRRRTRAVIATLAAVVLLVTSLAIWGEIQRRHSKKSQQQAEQSADEAQRRLVRMNISNGNRLLAERDVPGALLWYVEAFKNDRQNASEEQMHRTRIGAVQRQCPALLKLWTVREGDLYTEADPDGERVATVRADGTAQVWDLATGKPVSPPLKHDGAVKWLAFSPDGRLLATMADDRTVRVWNANSGEPVTALLKHESKIAFLQFNQDATQLATADDNNVLRLWHLPDGLAPGQPVRLASVSGKGSSPNVAPFELSPDGLKVAVPEAEGLVIRETQTGRPFGPPIPVGEFFIDLLTWSSDSSRLAFATLNKIKVVDCRSYKVITMIDFTSPNLTSLCFNHDATRLAAGSGFNQGTTKVFDATTGAQVGEPATTSEPVYGVEFSPDGLDVISYCTLKGVDRSTIMLKKMAGGTVNSVLKQSANVYHGRLTRDGRKVITECMTASAFNRGTPWGLVSSFAAPPSGILSPGDQIRVWELMTGGPAIKPFPHESIVETLALNPARTRAVTVGGSRTLWTRAATGTARLWDRATGRQIGLPLQHDAYIDGALFSADGGELITWSVEGSLRVWSSEDGHALGTPIRQPLHLALVELNRAGDRILTLCRKGGIFRSYIATQAIMPKPPQFDNEPTVTVWDAKTGQAVGKPLEHPRSVISCGFDADGRRVVTVDGQGTARLWDPERGTVSTPGWANGLLVWSHVMSPDGRVVAINTRDRTIRLGDVAGAKHGAQIPYDGYVRTMRFDTAGERLLTIRSDGIARIWDVRLGEPGTPPFGDHEIRDGTFLGRDLALLATTDDEGVVQLWDTATADPIGRDLGHLDQARIEAFDGESRILTTSTRLGIFEWDLTPASETIEQLEQRAHVNSGRAIDMTRGEAPLSLASLAEAWNGLPQAQRPAAGGLNDQAAEGWHWARWQESLRYSDENPLSVILHTTALIDRKPRQPGLHQARGRACLLLGKNDQAVAQFRDELAILREQPGHDRYLEAVALHLIATATLQLGRAEDAERAAREALALFREVSGEQSLDVARARGNLALIAQKRGDFAEAVAQWGQALQTVSMSPAFPVNDDDRTGLTFALARDHFRIGQPERTETVLLGYEKELRSSSMFAQDTAIKQKWTRTMGELTQFYRAWNKLDKAAEIEGRLKESGLAQATSSQSSPGGPSSPAKTGTPAAPKNANEGRPPGAPAADSGRATTMSGTDPTPPDSPSPRARRRDAIAMLRRIQAKYELDDAGDINSISVASAAMTDQDLGLLAQLPALDSLYLVRGPSGPVRHRISDQGLSVLAQMPALRTLYLNGSPFTDAALVHVAGLTELRKLGLSETKITDAGLVHLKNLVKLEFLALSGTAITDEGTASLRDLRSLQTLLLSGTNVTAEGVHGLRDALPKCTIGN